MKKLHSLAFYVLITPAITLGSSALLAEESDNGTRDLGEQSMGHDAAPDEQSSQQDKDTTKSSYNTGEASLESGDQPDTQNTGYMESPPANGMAASDLIGTDLKTSDGESVGEISDLIIDQDGKIGAVLVNVGGFLAMGEKSVAIDWNAVTMSANADGQDPTVDMTRDDLQSAPTYEQLDDRRPNAPSNLTVE